MYYKGNRVRVTERNIAGAQIGKSFVGTIVEADYGVKDSEHLYDVRPDDIKHLDELTRDQLDRGCFVACPDELELLQ